MEHEEEWTWEVEKIVNVKVLLISSAEEGVTEQMQRSSQGTRCLPYRRPKG